MTQIIIRIVLASIAAGFIAAILQLIIHFYKQLKQIKGNKDETISTDTNNK